MHSALPQPTGDVKNRNRSNWQMARSSNNFGKLLATVCGIIFLIYVIAFHPFWGQKVYYNGSIRPNSDIMVVSKTPYIYPDLKELPHYRDGQWVRVAEDQSVKSHRYGVVYGGSPQSSPKVVLVVGLDDSFSQEYLENVLQDRLDYAKQHGYGLYARYMKDFAHAEDESSTEFSKVMLMREAMFAFKDSEWMWWLDQDAIIMNHQFSVDKELLDPSRLTNYMIRDAPILPPESIIHTYKRVPASNIKFILTQNDRGMSTSSFLVRNDEIYGRVLMGYWSDPLHRSYPGFQGSSGLYGQLEASLSHMVQWHPAILSKMAVVPHSVLGARPNDGNVLPNQKFKPGDFVYLVRDANEVDFPGIAKITEDWNAAKQTKGDDSVKETGSEGEKKEKEQGETSQNQ